MKNLKIKNLDEKDIENLKQIKIIELEEMKLQDLKILKVKIETAIDNKKKIRVLYDSLFFYISAPAFPFATISVL